MSVSHILKFFREILCAWALRFQDIDGNMHLIRLSSVARRNLLLFRVCIIGLNMAIIKEIFHLERFIARQNVPRLSQLLNQGNAHHILSKLAKQTRRRMSQMSGHFWIKFI